MHVRLAAPDVAPAGASRYVGTRSTYYHSMSADEGGVAGEVGVPASGVRFTVDIEISPNGQGAARRRRLALERPQEGTLEALLHAIDDTFHSHLVEGFFFAHSVLSESIAVYTDNNCAPFMWDGAHPPSRSEWAASHESLKTTLPNDACRVLVCIRSIDLVSDGGRPVPLVPRRRILTDSLAHLPQHRHLAKELVVNKGRIHVADLGDGGDTSAFTRRLAGEGLGGVCAAVFPRVHGLLGAILEYVFYDAPCPAQLRHALGTSFVCIFVATHHAACCCAAGLRVAVFAASVAATYSHTRSRLPACAPLRRAAMGAMVASVGRVRRDGQSSPADEL